MENEQPPYEILLSVSNLNYQSLSPSRARCNSKTGHHNQDRSRRATNHRRILTRPVLIVAIGLGFATPHHSALARQISCESDHWRRNYDVVKIFKMAAVYVKNQLLVPVW